MVSIGNIQLPDFPLLLAPMEDVSDPPFRAVCKDNGADLMYTEFISSEGLIRDAIKSKQKLDIYDYERPIGIQIFGGDEEAMALCTKIVWLPRKKSSDERGWRRRLKRPRFDGTFNRSGGKKYQPPGDSKNKIGMG